MKENTSRLVRAYTLGERVYGITDNCAVYLLNFREVFGDGSERKGQQYGQDVA